MMLHWRGGSRAGPASQRPTTRLPLLCSHGRFIGLSSRWPDSKPLPCRLSERPRNLGVKGWRCHGAVLSVVQSYYFSINSLARGYQLREKSIMTLTNDSQPESWVALCLWASDPISIYVAIIRIASHSCLSVRTFRACDRPAEVGRSFGTQDAPSCAVRYGERATRSDAPPPWHDLICCDAARCRPIDVTKIAHTTAPKTPTQSAATLAWT
jgi:hypothetical protein